MSTGVNGRLSENSHILTDGKGHQAQYSENGDPSSPVSIDTQQLVMDDGSLDAEKNSAPFASFNYINSIIGSGIIGMPYAIYQAGFGVGIILLFVVAIITDYSLILLIKGGLLAGTKTYQGLMEAAFGRPGFYILSFIQFLYPFIAMISYNIIIGDTITKVLIRIIGVRSVGILGNRNFIVALVTLFVTLPLSLFRQLAKLAKISLLSLIFIVFIVISILIRAGTMRDQVQASEDAWEFGNTGITQAIGVMAFAYMCHHNSFLLYDSLKTPTQGSWNKVTHASVLVALVLFLLLGIGGYVTFTGYSQGDVLENYCITDDLMNASRIIFSITIMLTYPLECFVSREVVENVFFSSWTHKPTYLHVAITSFVVLVTYLVSLATDCLGIVLELNGVIAAVPLAYILPSLCYLKLEVAPFLSWKKFPAVLTALFGTVVAIVGCVLTFTNPSESKCSHGAEMPYCLAEKSWSVTNSTVLMSALGAFTEFPMLPTPLE